MKNETRQLWELCFKDDKEFTELYFKLRYKDERNRGIYENGRLIAALQVIPYPMKYGNRIISTGYISGACTHPSFRSKGVMKQLLEETHRQMYKDNIWLSILIPAEESLFDYYQKAGYATVFKYSLESVYISTQKNDSRFEIKEYTPFQLDVPEYINRKMQQRHCCILHTPEDLNVIINDLNLNKGELLIARLNGEIVGIIIYVPREDSLYVKEILFENEEIKTALIQEAARKTQTHKLLCITPEKEIPGKKLGMARVIHAEPILRIWAKLHPEQNVYLALSDENIPENTGFYHLTKGIFRKFTVPRTEKYSSFNIRELTKWLFKDQAPYMSLMLND